MTAVTEAVNSIGSSFRTGGRSIPSARPLLERRFPFCTAQPLFGAVRAKQRRQRVPVRRSEHDFFFGVAKQFQTVEVEMAKRRNCRVSTAQFGRCRNTIQALLWARRGAEA